MPTFGVVVPSFGSFADPVVDAELTRVVEELGYDSIWYGDHIVVPGYAAHLLPADWIDPIAHCLVGLGRTTRLRFGTEVLVAPYRNPVVTAKLLASADVLGGGRLTPAFGVGYLRGEFEALDAPPYDRRGDVTDEYLSVVRTLWDSEGACSFEGTYIEFSDVHFGPRPLQAPMPLWVGGNGPAALRRAATLGTGWHPLFPTPEQYAAGRTRILEQRRRHGLDGPFTFSYSCGTTRLLDDPGGPYVTGSWADLDDVPEDFGYAPAMPSDPDGRPHFVGTPAQVIEDVRRYAEAGVEHLVLRFASGGPETTPDQMLDQLERFARDVVPAVAAAPPTP
ncbi:MAG: TIGR03619 family F420-dependent LLM class oxidoreductase [Microthrixaceae bacterium]